VVDGPDVYPSSPTAAVSTAPVPTAVVPLPSVAQPISSSLTVAQTLSLSLAAAALFPVLTALALGSWIYLDAVARESPHPLRWAVEVTFVPPVLLAYVHYRGERSGPQSDRERLALTVLLALLMAMMVGTIFSPPDVFAQPRNTFGGLLVTLPLFYWIVYRDDAEPEESGASESEE